MLVDEYPSRVKLVWRYERWHHEIDYSGFEKNMLKKKAGLVIPKGVNNYGMKLMEID
jgi:hypothetical protein